MSDLVGNLKRVFLLHGSYIYIITRQLSIRAPVESSEHFRDTRSVLVIMCGPPSCPTLARFNIFYVLFNVGEQTDDHI